MSVLINIDVLDLGAASAFYTAAFNLKVNRKFGADAIELTGWPSPVYLLRKDAGTEFLTELRDMPFGVYGRLTDRYGVEWFFRGVNAAA